MAGVTWPSDYMKLYKYLPRKFMDSVVGGDILFRSLAYFRDYEDEKIRGDNYEGIRKFAGEGGLEIHNLTTAKKSKEEWIFKSNVDAENIFIFSTSTLLSEDLARDFESDICIEFEDIGRLMAGLKSAIYRRKSVKPNMLYHGPVKYYAESEGPGIDWSFPERISNSKLRCFEYQSEYRFMFSLNNALSFGNTSHEIQISEMEKEKAKKEYPSKVLKIGSLRSCCKIHEFK